MDQGTTKYGIKMAYVAYFYEAFKEEEKELRKNLPEGMKAGFTWKTIQESGDKSPPAQIISTRTQSIYPIEWAAKIKAIIARSTGYDHLLAYRNTTQSNIALGYLPHYCSRAVAEHAMMLWTVLMRKLQIQIKQFKKFERDGLTGRELKDKTLVVYGVGNIGYQIVKIGYGLDMRVFGVDLVKKYSDVKYLNPREAAKQADIIVCAMNLTQQNVDYFNESFFKDVKPTVLFINIARGEMAPLATILDNLQRKTIAGAALDVFDQESKLSVLMRNTSGEQNSKINAIKKMLTMDNVILTPHNAFNTTESVVRKSEQTMEQLKYFLQEGKFKWQV